MLVIEKMKYENMLKMTEHLYQKNYYLNSDTDIKITFERLEFIEPAGAVLFLSTIDKLKEDNIPYEIEPINKFRYRAAVSYGENMGIFQKIGISEAHSFSSGTTYLAPTKIELNEVYKELGDLGESIEEYYDKISERIVNKALTLASTNLEDEVQDIFVYVVREMIRNIFDHSNTTHYYYALQFYSASNCVEVVIADVGVGLLATIPFDVEEKWFGKNTHEEAIRKALTPGLSALSNHLYASEEYKNSGYGLALVKRIIQQTEGVFSIASGLKSITYKGIEEIIDNCDINGTIIRMKINLEKLKHVNFQDILRDAELEAKEKGYKRSPSSASKTLKSKNKNRI